MLADIGCKYVIVGHSERRPNRGEVDSLVLKATNAQKYNLIPIVCVGESTKDRNGNALSVIEKQLELLCHQTVII